MIRQPIKVGDHEIIQIILYPIIFKNLLKLRMIKNLNHSFDIVN